MANPGQADKPTVTYSQFKISSAMRRHKKKTEKITKYISANKDDDKVLIDTAITLE